MLETQPIHAVDVRRLGPLAWIALAGCATEPSVVPQAASATPPTADARREASPDAGSVPQPRTRSWDEIVRIHRIEAMALEAEVRMFDLERRLRLEETDRSSCAFYWNPDDRPLPQSRETVPGLTRSDLDRVANSIDGLRADIADSADRAWFDREVRQPFLHARVRFEIVMSH